MRKTKIVCTLGPKTDEEGALISLAEAGMDVARLNFSHGTREEQKRRIDSVKALRKKMKKPIGIMLDTKGPEIRIGKFAHGFADLKKGELFTLCAYETEGGDDKVSVNYPVQNVVCEGERILLDDGLIVLRVERHEGQEVVCRVEVGGELKNCKSINIPSREIDMPYMTDSDIEDIKFGVGEGVDFIAASFVRSAEDVKELRSLLKKCGGGDIEVISKIENMRGVKNIDEIIEVSDGIMVARGDLGVEIAMESLPGIQKKIIKKCLQKGKRCVTATQMLDSMIKNPRPTRAEVTDIANAVLDGTDAVMLSGETAAGEWGVESVKVMDAVIRETEKELPHIFTEAETVTEVIACGAKTAAKSLDAKVILCVTHSGYTANMVAKYRPSCPVAAVTTDEVSYYAMSLTWGVRAYLSAKTKEPHERFENALKTVEEEALAKSGDRVVVTGGDIAGMTNILKIVQI